MIVDFEMNALFIFNIEKKFFENVRSLLIENEMKFEKVERIFCLILVNLEFHSKDDWSPPLTSDTIPLLHFLRSVWVFSLILCEMYIC